MLQSLVVMTLATALLNPELMLNNVHRRNSVRRRPRCDMGRRRCNGRWTAQQQRGGSDQRESGVADEPAIGPSGQDHYAAWLGCLLHGWHSLRRG